MFPFQNVFDQVLFVARLSQEPPEPPLQGAPSPGQSQVLHTALKVHKLLKHQEEFFNAKIISKRYWECLLIFSPCEEATIFFLSSTVARRLQSEGYLLYREPRNMRR